MTNDWKSFRSTLNLTPEEESLVSLEKNLIHTLTSARQEKGLSQKELAELCGVPQSAIGRLERGKHSPQLNSLLKVLQALGYTLQIIPLKK